MRVFTRSAARRYLCSEGPCPDRLLWAVGSYEEEPLLGLGRWIAVGNPVGTWMEAKSLQLKGCLMIETSWDEERGPYGDYFLHREWTPVMGGKSPSRARKRMRKAQG